MLCMLFSVYLFLDLSKSESLCILFLRCGNIWMCVSAIDYKCTECLTFWPCDPVSVLGFKGRPWAVSRSGSTRREGEESATGLCVRLSVPLLFAMFVSWPHESSPPPFHLLAAFGLWCGIHFFFSPQCCEMIPKCWHSSYSRVSTKDYSASPWQVRKY